MKIQRWSDRAGCGMTVNDEGRYVQFSDIQHLIPAENPDWEPCEIGEATHVMNARGETFPGILDSEFEWLGVDLDKSHPVPFSETDLRNACLTPVRRRKVEPVVFETTIVGEVLGNWIVDMGSDTRDLTGQKVRVTVEVIQEDK